MRPSLRKMTRFGKILMRPPFVQPFAILGISYEVNPMYPSCRRRQQQRRREAIHQMKSKVPFEDYDENDKTLERVVDQYFRGMVHFEETHQTKNGKLRGIRFFDNQIFEIRHSVIKLSKWRYCLLNASKGPFLQNNLHTAGSLRDIL